MTRYIDPNPQYLDSNGDPLAFGQLFFYASDTNTFQDTYSDSSLNNPNANPIRLDAAGRSPVGIFLDGVYKVILRSKPTNDSPSGELIWELDPVAGDAGSRQFGADWVPNTIYNRYDTVRGSDGCLYESLVNDNQGNDPTLDDGTNWQRIYYNFPTTQNETSSQLENNKLNILKDSSTFKLPDTTNTDTPVKVGDVTYCVLPDEFTLQQPTIEVFDSGTETITYRDGIDTDVLMDVGTKTISFEYIGAGQWRLSF